MAPAVARRTCLDPFSDAALSPDGRYVATKNSLSGIHLWNTMTASLVATIADRNTADAPITYESMQFSPGGQTLAWNECSNSGVGCQSDQVVLWSIVTQQILHILPLSATPISGPGVSLTFSPDGKLLAAGTFDPLTQQFVGLVEIFATGTGNVLQRIPLGTSDPTSDPRSQPGTVYNLAFSPDGTTLAIAGRHDANGITGQVLFWDVVRQQFVGPPLVESASDIYAEAYSPNGRYLVVGMSSGEFGLQVWDTQQRTPVTPLLKAHSGFINSIAFSPDGEHFVSCADDQQVLIWRLVPFTPLSHLTGNDFNGLSEVAFSPDGTLLATGSTNTITLWNVKTGAKVKTLLVPAADRTDADGTVVDDEIASLAFSPDGATLAAGDALAQVILWNITLGQPIAAPLQGHSTPLPGTLFNLVSDLSFSPNGRLLASSGFDGQVILWNAQTLPQVHVFPGAIFELCQAAFSPDGRYLAVTGTAQDIFIWDVVKQSLACTIKTTVRIRAIAFYPHHAATVAALDANA